MAKAQADGAFKLGFQRLLRTRAFLSPLLYLENMDDHNKRLTRFFSGCFHQDWMDDDPSWEAVVDGYIETFSVEEIRLLYASLMNIHNTNSCNNIIEECIYKNYGGYYMPSGSGQSARAWIKLVADRMIERVKK